MRVGYQFIFILKRVFCNNFSDYFLGFVFHFPLRDIFREVVDLYVSTIILLCVFAVKEIKKSNICEKTYFLSVVESCCFSSAYP